MNIYKITNLINGKIYVGKDTKNRKRYYGSGIVIRQAIKKYGKENFKKEILENCSDYQTLNEREKYWIEVNNSTDKNIGYNRSYGGDGFSGITPETIEKIRQKHIGQKRTLECRNKISKSRIGMKFTKKHKKNLSIARKKRITKPETLEKMRKSMLGKNRKYVKYIIIDPNGMEYHTDNISQFCREHDIQHGNLYKVLRKERDNTKGYKIRREE
jgi:group I intron endonuclease